ncbi:MAG TPA: TRAP transporter substrate-binding protein DctP, partial [Paracoccaceae bacterium]|nr:TRAP transporter substrate-binding protein DctP [Paracoccaceae bacterium]
PLGPPPGHFERLQSGAAEVACSLHGYAGQGAFPRARLGQLSFLGDSYGASPVFADIYMNDLAGAAEHEGIKLLGVFEHGPGQLFLRDRAIASPQDFKGLRIRNPGGYIASLLTDLGVEAVSTPVERVAPALESGEIDGAAFPYSAIQAFGVLGKFDHALELPGGFYNASWYFGINGARWQAIEARDRQAIDSIAGPLIAELAGKAFDDADHVARESCRAAGVNIYRASEEVEAFVRQAGSRHEQQWIDHVTAEGFEGDYLLGKLRRRTMVDRL